MDSFDELILHNISCYIPYEERVSFETLVRKDIRRGDNIWAFLPEYLYRYAIRNHKRSGEEKERIISQDPKYSYHYCLNILKRRWNEEEGREERERIISQDPKWSCLYCLNFLEGRWSEEEGREEKERILSQDPEWSYLYHLDTLKIR